jgi:aspartate/methionine/tyrosine aminotransferase
MAEALRKQKEVLVVPGEQLGMDSYLRLGFGGNPESLQKALGRVAEWIEEKQMQ